MSEVYEFVGRLVLWAIMTRYRTQLRVAAGVGVGAVIVGAFLAARRVPPEG
jgi:hypothetical protein